MNIFQARGFSTVSLSGWNVIDVNGYKMHNENLPRRIMGMIVGLMLLAGCAQRGTSSPQDVIFIT
jgi:hypothetical protein